MCAPLRLLTFLNVRSKKIKTLLSAHVCSLLIGRLCLRLKTNMVDKLSVPLSPRQLMKAATFIGQSGSLTSIRLSQMGVFS